MNPYERLKQKYKKKQLCVLNMIEITFTHNVYICPENCVMVVFVSIWNALICLDFELLLYL